MFSLPPTNHFACGTSHSRIFFGFSNQSIFSASSAQKASGSAAALANISSYSSIEPTRAFFENSAGGGIGGSSSTCGSNSCIAVSSEAEDRSENAPQQRAQFREPYGGYKLREPCKPVKPREAGGSARILISLGVSQRDLAGSFVQETPHSTRRSRGVTVGAPEFIRGRSA